MNIPRARACQHACQHLCVRACLARSCIEQDTAVCENQSTVGQSARRIVPWMREVRRRGARRFSVHVPVLNMLTNTRERGEKGPNFGDSNCGRRLTLAEVEAKRMRHGERFQSKSKKQINYSFTPSSQYKGVSLLHGVWTARIIQAGKRISLGSYRSEEEAARAWDRRARQEGRAFLNFPDEV